LPQGRTGTQPDAAALQARIAELENLLEHLQEDQRLERESFEQAMDAARSGFWAWNLAEDTVELSPAACRILGRETGRALWNRRELAMLIHPDDLPDARNALLALLEKDAPAVADVTLRMCLQPGRWRWLRVRTAVAARDAAGAAHRLAGLVEDVSEAQAARQALEATAKKFQLLAERSIDVIWLTDAGLNFVYVSPSAEQTFGYRPEEVIGRSVQLTMTPESWEEAVALNRSRMEHRGPGAQDMPSHAEYEQVRKDGSRLWTDVVAAPVYDEEHRLAGYHGITRDITARKKQEEEILRLRHAVECAHDGIAIAEPDGQIIYLNPAMAALLGYNSAEELNGAGGTYAVIKPRERADEGLRLLRRGEDWAGEIRLHTGQGKAIPCLLRTSPVTNDKGTLTYLLAIATDITRQKQVEQERRDLESKMLQSQKLESLGVLAGGIAHDFNNLLMVILGNAELAMDLLASNDEPRHMLSEIQQAAHRAADLSRQMLAYSGRGLTETTLVDMNAFVAESAEILVSALAGRAEFSIDAPADLPPVRADAQQLRQILLNLAANASEALQDRHGRIDITAGTLHLDELPPAAVDMGQAIMPGRYVFLDVRDNGCGIPGDVRQRIFDPFFTTKAMGRGLGLSAVYGIVRAHGGAILVTSEPGGGAAFRVLFPAADAPEPAAAVPEPAPAGERLQGTVLLVEDERAVRVITRSILENMGLTVIEAGNGQEGLARFFEHAGSIGCVLLDLLMPIMGGEEVLADIRRVSPDTRVVLASGLGEKEMRERFDITGACALLQKPYRRNALEQVLRPLFQPADETPPPG
jgi:PAS domain S-box-containing protein